MKLKLRSGPSHCAHAIKDDTVGGYKAYVGTLRALLNPARFTLLKFDSNKVEKIHVGAPIAETPDARVVVAIQTDGHENCSSRYRQADLLARATCNSG